ncbi:MAG: endolytic transglycosylase MltG [Alphaproteobacteria bacterium]|nr:endolytic transglycosylase MltG [Alphaproteobacteria bacterium]
MSENLPNASPRLQLVREQEEYPPARKRSERARNPVVMVGNAIISILFVAALVAAGVAEYGKRDMDTPGPLQEDKIVNIPARVGKRDIAEALNAEGVINVDPWRFMIAVYLRGAAQDLKPGEYSFHKNASLREVIATIVEGKVVQHAVTLPEGLTSEQIVARLTENPIFVGSVRELPREGTLLPETYKFPRGTPREQVLQRMQQAHKRALTEVWERRSPDLPIKTQEQLVTLASIIEKETGRADERSRVAAVYVNRLRKKMRLQSDPTIIYGLVGGKGTLGRPIRKSEITQPSPYNTYVIDGLPPGPIANPGRASLEAAANPAHTQDLFFVADGTGGHVFTETYDAHKANVAKLRAMEKQNQNDTVEQTEEAPDAATAPRPAPRRPAVRTAPAAAPPSAPAAVPLTPRPGVAAPPPQRTF